MFKHCIMIRVISATLALAGIALLVGCGGLNQQPLAPAATALQGSGGKAYSSSGPAYIVFSSQALDASRALARAVGSGQQAALHAETASGTFSLDQAGSLSVRFPSYSSDDAIQVKEAVLEVEKGAITGGHKVTMEVTSGAILEDVRVMFDPSDVISRLPARLMISLEGKIDADGLNAYYVEGPGPNGYRVTRVPIRISSGDQESQITRGDLSQPRATKPADGSGSQIILLTPDLGIYSLGDD